MDFGVYVHVPYCRVQCPYCTFFTVPRAQDPGDMERFAAALGREWRARVVPRLLSGDRLATLYLGGGTPSDLPAAVLQRLLAGFGADLDGGLARCDEVTVECNPESATPALLDGLAGLGVGRVSLGIQAQHDDDLRALGRGGTAADNRTALGEVGARFRTWNADLILGIPGSSRHRLEAALEGLIAAGAPHLSFYCLELPPGTARMLGDPQSETSEAWKAELYEWTSARVEEHGFVHYEISNAARPGHESVHNTAYWRGDEYVGLGPGAHSYESGIRRANRPDLRRYLVALEAGEEPPAAIEVLTDEMRARERVLLGLRLRSGLPEDAVRAEALPRLEAAGLAAVLDGRVRLTPRGWMVSDSIILQLVRS